MSFEPNPYWSSTYVGTDEIQQYFLRFTEKYDLRKYCQFNKRVSRAEWDNVKGQWNVQVTDLKTGNSVHDWCHFLINAQGVLNNWKWPDIPGIDKFEGKILHTAKYDRSLDLTDKTVALLGTGYVNENNFFHPSTDTFKSSSSAIQTLPAILPKVKSVITFNRSASWVLPTQGFAQHFYTDEEKQTFASDSKKLEQHRRELDSSLNELFPLFLKDSLFQKTFTSNMRDTMAQKLVGSDLQDKVIPKWGVGCRRITPGVGYLEALVHEKTKVVSYGVKEITPKGCKSDDEKEYPVDVIICATGFNVSYLPRFPVIGFNGVSLEDAWKNEPNNYLGFAVAEFPNYFIVVGPNSPVGNGPVLICIGKQTSLYFPSFSPVTEP